MKWIRANEVTPISDTYFKVGGLHEDIDYEFRVAAENRAGLGPYSEVSSSVKTYVHKGPSSVSAIGSRPSDHYFRSVCWFVCLCRVFLSRL